jgi:hypothetical protein
LTIDEGRQGGELTPTSQRFGELVAAANHAGSVIREQIGTILEAAQTNAADAERTSRENAESTRQEAAASAARILDLIRNAERQVGDLRRSAAREADALRVALGKSAASAGPALGSGDALDSVATPYEAEIGPGGDEPPAGPAIADEAPAESDVSETAAAEEAAAEEAAAAERAAAEEAAAAEQAAAEEAAATEAAAAEQAAAEEAAAAEAAAAEEPEAAEESAAGEPEPEVADQAETEEPVAGNGAEAAAEPTSGGGAGDLQAAISRAQEQGAAALGFGAPDQAEDAQRRVAGKTDDELAESYEIAVEARARAEKSGSEEEVGYWELLVQAAVKEAVGRPTFGEPGPEDESLSRRERRKKARRLKGLSQAREQALGARGQTGEQ